jgi:hypothetical protein
MGVLFRFTAGLNPKLSFAIVGGTGIFLTCILIFMIKEPDLRAKKPIA